MAHVARAMGFDVAALASAVTIAKSEPGSLAWPPAIVEIYRSLDSRLSLL